MDIQIKVAQPKGLPHGRGLLFFIVTRISTPLCSTIAMNGEWPTNRSSMY
jgi:hypothetical protein